MKLTVQDVRKFMDYDPETGVFIWRARDVRSKYDKIWNTQNAGQIAGCNAHHGYRSITIYGKRYYAHRLAYFYMTGEMPNRIDHKDGDTTNNRFLNLRPATQGQNRANSARSSANSSGYKGVSFNRSLGKWQAFLVIDRKSIWLGLHDTAENAAAAYDRAAIEHFGEFARLNAPPCPVPLP